MGVSTPSLVGRTLGGRYRLDRMGAEEHRGRLYIATDLREQRIALVKVFDLARRSDPAAVIAFTLEAGHVLALEHPHVVRALDRGRDEGLHWYALAYLNGRPLSEELAFGALPLVRVASISAQIADGLQAVHALEVAHGGVTAASVLLLNNAVRGDFACLSDFGRSQPVGAGEQGAPGHPAYLAPERVRGGPATPAADMYALGALMYEMVVGRPPFVGTQSAVLEQHLQTLPAPPSSRDEELPDWVDEVVLRLLSKRPADRPEAADAHALLRRATGWKLAAPELVPLDAMGALVAPAPARGPTLWIAAALLLSLAIPGAGVAGLLASGMLAVGLQGGVPTVELTPQAPYAGGGPGVFGRGGADPEPLEPPPELAPPPPPPPPRPAPAPVVQRVHVKANARALVFVDGAPIGLAPAHRALPRGAHQVTAMLPGRPETAQSRAIHLDRGETERVEFTFDVE